MTDVLHLIDASAAADAIEQMLAVRTTSQPLVSLGPPPEHTALPEVRCIHRPLGNSSMAGRALRPHLPLGGVVHAWSLPAAEAACYAGVAVVLSLSETTRLADLAPLPWSLARLTCRITAPTQHMLDALQAAGLKDQQLTLLPPLTAAPINRDATRKSVRKQLGLGADELLIVAPAEMTADARHRKILWAHAICGHAGVHPHLLLPGGGRELNKLKRFSETTGFDAQVHFTGHDILRQQALAACDIAIFADAAPAGATLLTQALRAGPAVILTQTADPANLLAPAAERCDGDVQPLARSILALIDDADRRDELAARTAALAAESRPDEPHGNLPAEIYASLAPACL
jgi:hypothetical protein